MKRFIKFTFGDIEVTHFIITNLLTEVLFNHLSGDECEVQVERTISFIV